jgi:RHS repeat-associated protein
MSWTDTIRRSTLPAPTESTSEWDALARTQTLSTFAGRESVASFDVRGRLESSRIGTLHPTKLSYDTRGRIDSIAQGPGTADRTTTFTYHPTTGRLASITDPASRTTTFDLYDAAGRVLAMTLPGERTIGFTYDANGNLASLAPPGKPTHVFRYTPVDQENEYEPPAIAGIPDPRTLYAYDLDRKLDFVTRPDGKTVDLAYDAATGHIEAVHLAEAGQPTLSYAYEYFPPTETPTTDPDGQLQSISAPAGAASETIAFAWDGTLPLGTTWTGPVAGSVSRTFDDDFRIATETVAGTSTVNFIYDDDGLLTSAGDLSITRNGQGAGLVTATEIGTVTTSETPNAYAELDADEARISGTPIYANTYPSRDALGRITAKTETLQAVTTTYGYTYTPAGQLDVVTINGAPARDYDYDANGNRTHVNGTLVGAYDAQDRLTSYQGTTYTYTAAGDLKTKIDVSGTTTYAYDALGNLRTATLHVGTPQQTRIEYVIDGQNRRIGKKVCAAPCTGGATAQLQQGFLYADQLRIVAELDGSNQLVSRFVYGTKAHVPDFLVKGGIGYRMLSDHLGSVRLVVNTATGAIAQRIDYDEWGNATYVSGAPDFQPFGFAGGLMDRDTGLVRFGARDYDPRVGRWTSKDPIRFEGLDPNLFTYALQDPVNLFDPTGLIAPLAGAALGAAAGGLTGFTLAVAMGVDLPVAAAVGLTGAAYGALGGATLGIGANAAVGGIGGALGAAVGGSGVCGVVLASAGGAAAGAIAGVPAAGGAGIAVSGFVGGLAGAALGAIGDELCPCGSE